MILGYVDLTDAGLRILQYRDIGIEFSNSAVRPCTSFTDQSVRSGMRGACIWACACANVRRHVRMWAKRNFSFSLSFPPDDPEQLREAINVPSSSWSGSYRRFRTRESDD